MHINKKIKEVGPFGRLFHYVTQFEDCGETYLVYKHWRKRKRYWEYETQHIEIWQYRQSFAKEFKTKKRKP